MRSVTGTWRKKMEPSFQYHKDGSLSCASGKEAVECVRVATLMSAIGLLTHGIQPTRGFTMKKALTMATTYTGQKYKRTETEKAKSDLKVWLENMKSTIPVRE